VTTRAARAVVHDVAPFLAVKPCRVKQDGFRRAA
jgi:hypothetical protein